MKWVLMAMMLMLSGEEHWTLDYDVYVEGPRTVYEGTAILHADERTLYPCLSYCFNVPKGRLAGPVISSNPGQPMLGFDWWEVQEDGLEVLWCRNSLPKHPFTGEDMQTYPISIPRNFKFYIIKTEFDGEDLVKMLNDWGSEDSPWDLTLDGLVDGADVNLLLSGWKID